MGLLDDITAQLPDAMRAKDTTRLAALRSARAAFLNEMKKDGADTLTDEACIVALRRLAKQRNESIEAFEAAGRPERVTEERAELAILEEFLPKLADEATTRSWVEAAIADSGAKAPGDLGRVMGALMKAHKGDVDGSAARRIAAELLADGA